MTPGRVGCNVIGCRWTAPAADPTAIPRLHAHCCRDHTLNELASVGLFAPWLIVILRALQRRRFPRRS